MLVSVTQYSEIAKDVNGNALPIGSLRLKCQVLTAAGALDPILPGCKFIRIATDSHIQIDLAGGSTDAQDDYFPARSVSIIAVREGQVYNIAVADAEDSGGGSGTVTSVDVSGGSTGLTFSGGPVTSVGTITMGGVLSVANGGTGASAGPAALTSLGAVAKAGDTMTGALTLWGDPVNPLHAASKQWVEGLVTGVYRLRGDINASGNPNYPAATAIGDTYTVTVAGRVGGASGKLVDVGDLVVAKAVNAGGTEAAVGTAWFVLEHNLVGALLAANNLADITDASAARTNLGLAIGVNVQAYSANLASYAGVAPSAFFLTLPGAANAAAFRGLIGAGTSSTVGTVTSVAMSVPTGFSIAGTPITAAGTLALTYTAGYQGYTAAEATKLAGIATGAQVGTVTSVAAGNGMSFGSITGSGSVVMGTPSSVTLASTNAVAAGTHSHAFAPGGDASQYIRGDGALATLPTITPAALSKVDDTNVTLTLGGTPLTALLQAVSITAGWTGTLSVARGGTGAGTLTGYVKGNGTGAFTASATIPNTDITGLGTMSVQNDSAVNITGGDITTTYFSATAASPIFQAISTAVIDTGTPASSAALGSINLNASGLGAASLGDLSSGISFGRKGTGRRGALIAGKHTGSDVNQMGLAFYCKSSTAAANSSLVERLILDHVGTLYPSLDNNVTLGAAANRWSTGYLQAVKLGDAVTVAFGGITNANYQQHSTGGSGSSYALSRWVASALAPQLIIAKSRGATVGTFSAVASGDTLGDYQAWGDNGTAMAVGTQIRAVTTELWSGTANGARLTFSVVAPTTTTLTEVARLDTTTGLSMFGANIVVDANRILRNRTYTVATVASATGIAGAQVYITNPTTGAARPYWSNGTSWYDATGTLLA